MPGQILTPGRVSAVVILLALLYAATQFRGRAANAIAKNESLERLDFRSDELWLARLTNEAVPITERHQAVRRLAESGERVVPRLIRCLDDHAPSVKRFAAMTLAMVGPPAIAAKPRLLEIAQEPELISSIAAIEALVAIDPTDRVVAQLVVERVRSENPAVRMSCVEALFKTRPVQENIWNELLRDSDLAIQLRAIEAAGRLGPEAEPLVPGLLRILGEDDPSATERAWSSLERLGHVSRPSIVEQAKNSDNPELKLRAALLLGVASREGAEEFLPVFLKEAENPRISASARYFLVFVFPNVARQSRPVLTKLLNSECRETRVLAALSLARMKSSGQELIAALTEGLHDSQPVFREMAADELRNLSALAEPAVPTLTLCLNDTHPSVVNRARRALEKITGKPVKIERHAMAGDLSEIVAPTRPPF